jgi:signal transduction histidine kinase
MEEFDRPADHRKQTDASLGEERSKTDDEILERSTAAGEDADEVIDRARRRAQAVLDSARARESDNVTPEVAALRAAEDIALQRSYDDADSALGDERARRRLAIRQLLALERRVTDHMLASERDVVDHTMVDRDVLDVIGHDLRSMLSMIMLSAGAIVLAADQLKPKHAIMELGNKIQHVAAQMDVALSDLKTAAEIDRGTSRTVLAKQDVLAVVRDAIEVHKLAAEANGVALTAQLPTSPVIVAIDAPRFGRVLTNVIANAIKFTPQHGSIRVIVARIDNEVEIAVADTGPGIPEHMHTAIFERFRQALHDSRGLGLGLYIARSIVNAHGGRIWVESVPGNGATFRVRLPSA